MVCKKCGGKHLPKSLEEWHEEQVLKVMRENENTSCEELSRIWACEIMSFRCEAARRLLIKRGHELE